MILNSIFDQNYKPQFSGHETFPLRYGWLEKAFEAVDADGFNNQKIFSDDSSIAHFGVGKNMVAAIRFWAQVAGVIATEGKDPHSTKFGQILFRDGGLDPYLENLSSLWRIHWEIASNPKHTGVYWLFNIFNDTNFDREIVMRQLSEFIVGQGWSLPTQKTLSSDINVLIANYVPSSSKRGPSEESLSSPLAELSLIRRDANAKYILNWGRKPSLNSGVFLYAVCDFWERSSTANTLNFQSLLLDRGSPGRIFLLEEADLAQRLSSISEATGGAISWSETAGLKQLIKNKEFSDEFLEGLWVSDFPPVGGEAHAA